MVIRRENLLGDDIETRVETVYDDLGDANTVCMNGGWVGFKTLHANGRNLSFSAQIGEITSRANRRNLIIIVIMRKYGTGNVVGHEFIYPSQKELLLKHLQSTGIGASFTVANVKIVKT
ncbi:hypothetical protein AT1G56105 [Arabidopsis thaliana]|uniref:Uncharacterized protein n=2 Tax=Arabidopsis thaliana TaxID=3702 RepID=A0A5S9WQF6_ARATH|nr:uncharacterized protein AT1G56105 [Arabidopsis thaliana]ANM58445.1 hypothetical protein AT1G56105 [Arabidopsis thaliana]CAA0298553.1 unnamed protein product [Arabidopsis thaliana]|eukprot:NP_001320879.1 hypothetical protein AT1G56105 [Arabidopsis thaliana]